VLKYHCDICGIPTELYPEGEIVYDKKDVEVKIPAKELVDSKDKDGKPIKILKDTHNVVSTKQKVPLTRTIRVQNVHGKKGTYEAPKMSYKNPKAIIVRLDLGTGDYPVKKDFCERCYGDYVETKAEELYKFLSNIEDKP